MKLDEIRKSKTRNRKGVMSNFDVCKNYGSGICVPMKPHRPCGECPQFYIEE